MAGLVCSFLLLYCNPIFVVLLFLLYVYLLSHPSISLLLCIRPSYVSTRIFYKVYKANSIAIIRYNKVLWIFVSIIDRLVDCRNSLSFELYSSHILKLHYFCFSFCFYCLILRNELTPYISPPIWVYLAIENIGSEFCTYHLAWIKEDNNGSLNKSSFLPFIKLFLNKIGCLGQFDAVWENWFIPSFFEFRIFLQYL